MQQDGATCILPAHDFLLGPTRSKIIFWCFIPCNKSLIDQPCSVKMAEYLPCSFFACLWFSRQYPAILTSCLVNNPYSTALPSEIHSHLSYKLKQQIISSCVTWIIQHIILLGTDLLFGSLFLFYCTFNPILWRSDFVSGGK